MPLFLIISLPSSGVHLKLFLSKHLISSSDKSYNFSLSQKDLNSGDFTKLLYAMKFFEATILSSFASSIGIILEMMAVSK